MEIQYRTAAAYIRVSDERQDEYSPDSQLKLSREYAKKNGYNIPDEFVFYDDGISGKSAKHRTAFNNMIAAAKDKDNGIEAIFVWKFSRFARNQEESIVYKSLLKKNGVDVISVSEPIIEGPFGSLIERIIEWMDEYYLIRLSGEVKRGMLEKATRGEAPCAPPMGYDLDGNTYKPNNDAPIVKEVFERYAAGEGMRSIANELSLRGITTKRGNPPDNRYIEYMLNNPVYIGKIRWSKEGRAASKRKYGSESIIIVDGLHSPIINMELWEKVQTRQQLQKFMYPKYQSSEQTKGYMLKGLIRCSNCGATLVSNGNKKNPGIQCHNYNRGSCRVSHCLTLEKADAAVKEALSTALITATFNISPKAPAVSSSNAATDYNKLIAAEEKRLERAKEAYRNGVDTLEEYQQAKASIQAKISSLKATQEKESEAAAFDVEAFTEKVSQVLDFINSDADEHAKNAALRSIIEYILYNKSEKRLDIHFHV